jgi:hypothetical protein
MLDAGFHPHPNLPIKMEGLFKRRRPRNFPSLAGWGLKIIPYFSIQHHLLTNGNYFVL